MSDRTAEEWGRIAVGLPGWRWLPGMLSPCRGVGRVDSGDLSDDPLYAVDFRDAWPDPDDPATAGCLLALLGPLSRVAHALSAADRMGLWSALIYALMVDPPTLGRACIAAAEALGRWPGGEG